MLHRNKIKLLMYKFNKSEKIIFKIIIKKIFHKIKMIKKVKIHFLHLNRLVR